MRRPSLKQKMFARKYVEKMGNATAAALEVYEVGNKHNATNIGNANLNKPVVQEEIKKIMLKKGIDLDWASDNLKDSIDKNLSEGKPSQAVGADLLKFVFKLHDVIPGAKNLNLSYTKKEIVANKDVETLTKELSDLNKLTATLVEDLQKT